MGRIPDETIETVRDRIDIVELVGRHVSLRQAGRNFKGLCPFHDEKTPSFHVHTERGIFHCFGCGVGGDAFQFLMRHDNLSFPEAARTLAREVGIEIPEQGGAAGVFDALRGANDCAQALYRSTWKAPEGEGARAYWISRGFGVEAADRYAIGFAPAAWDRLRRALGQSGFDAALGERAGLLAARTRGDGHYDRFRGRLVFPIQDVRGRVIGFGGRALDSDQEPKYLNTPETPIFRKREAFYGFPEALAPMRRAERAVVVEGYFDRIALAEAGISEAVATCGTALSEDHAKQLRRHTREVVLLFDGDDAGYRAVLRSLELLLPQGLRVRMGLLPRGEDPADVLARRGPDALRRTVEDAPPALEAVIERAAAAGRRSAWEKADAVRAVVDLLARVPDPVERGEFARRLALCLDVRLADVDEALQRARSGSPGFDEAAVVARPRQVGPEARAARQLVQLFFAHPDLWDRTDPTVLSEWLPDPPWRHLWPALARTQRAGAATAAPGALAPPDDLDGEARAEWLALAVQDSPTVEKGEATRALDDTLAWLRRRYEARRRRETTERLRGDPTADPLEILAEKQRQLEERRLAMGLPPGPARADGRA